MKENETYEFEKSGYKFFFRNPTWDSFNTCLEMEYKILGIHENKNNDGYYHSSVFNKNNGTMNLYNVAINGKKYEGVILPPDILEKIATIYDQYKEKDFQCKSAKDIRYTMHDMDSYGIYNGISEFEISAIVSSIKKNIECHACIFCDEIANNLNKDNELKNIAEKTFIPEQEHKDWSDEYRSIFREYVKRGTAPGYGTIPNKVIKEKITAILRFQMETENKEKQNEINRIKNIFELAKHTGKKQILKSWYEPCNDSEEECNLDVCCEYAMPDGTKEKTRNHTW